VDLHPLGQQVGGRFVAGLLDRRKDRAGGANHGFLILDQLPDHLFRLRHAGLFLKAGQLGELGIAARRRQAQRPNAFGD
jgi:hypothetical protein